MTAAISAFMLISLISVFQAGTASALDGAVRDRTTAITAAADRLVEEQNPDGGFRMWISETPPGTYLRTHNIGVTAIGILKAHELLDKAEYETALAKTYKFVVDYVPGWIEDPNDATKWKESPSGVNSWPDIHFLIGLAEAAALDSSLLAAIQSEVPETTVSDIVELAKDRWDDRLVHYGAVPPNVDGTATTMAERLIEVRLGTWESLIPWDLEAAVKSALALHEKYPEEGYLAQAQDITEVIYDCLYGTTIYLDINDPEEKCYTLGLAGAIEAFTEAGLYPDEASELKTLLIEYQSETGYWDASELSDQESVQATAYSIMALIAQGDDDARTAAVKGSNWLVNTQDELGGWDPSSLESGDECLEVDGEAAWALATAEAPVTIGEDGYYSIQSAIDSANLNDTINVAAGTYDLDSPIVVDESVTITGDTATPSNVVINAPTTAGLYDRDCFQVIANDVTIQGFKIVGAMDDREGDHPAWGQPGRQNAGIMVGSEATLTTQGVYRGISGGTFSYNEIVDCSKGLYLYHATDCEVSHNTITTTEGQDPDNFYDTMGWNGDGIHVYLEVASDYPTGNIISHNIMNNVRVGVMLNGDRIGGTDPSAWDFHDTTIENNIMTDVWIAGIILQCASGTAEEPITLKGNTITTSTGPRTGDEVNEHGLVSVHGDYAYIISNTLSNSHEHGMWLDGSHHAITGNIITSNTLDGIHIGWYKEVESTFGSLPGITRTYININLNNIYGNTGEGVDGVQTDATVDATLNWWGDPTGPRNPTTNSSATGDDVSDYVDYTPWLDASYLTGVARNWNVQNVDTGDNFNSIQAAIDVAEPGETVLVHPGTYTEAPRIDEALTVRSTDGAEKTIIYGTSYYIVYIRHSDVTFDGFTITYPTFEGSSDISGILVGAYLGEPVDNVHILNNIVKAVRSESGAPSYYGATGINIGRQPLSNVVISGNTIENIKNPEGGASDHTCGINVWDDAENVLISNNAISDIKYNGIILEYASNVRIENNAITECEVGIRVEPFEGATVANLTINYNNIVGNREYGVLNTMIDFIDATLNWWGDPGGPGADEDGNSVYGDNVSANVNYDPWLPRTLPTISDVSVSGVTTTSATITWTTALPANSRVEYGPTIAYGLTSSIPDLTTSHSLGLTGLTPSTTYHFRVRSEDAYGHVDNSGDLTFITAAPPPPATLTVDTTPIKANVYVDGSLLGVALRTRSLAAGTYTISFGDVLGYLTPAPEIVTLAAGETRTVEGVYTEIPPENIENQSPTYDLPSITPDENATILVENTALTEITIQVKNAAENVKITVQEVTEGAAGIAIGAPGATYKYLNIVAENITDAQIESVVIRFKVEKSWIILNDIDIATITLNHYDPLTGEWTSLPTTYLSEDDTYVYFSAISPGLSIFGVSGSTIIPTNFELSNLVITPSEVSVGETVTISVVVNNAGGQTGSTTVNLEINGAAVDTRSVTLDAGKSTTVTFTVSEDVADTYTVNVAGLTGSFVVTAPPAPPIVPLAVSIIIIVLAIGIVLWFRRIG